MRAFAKALFVNSVGRFPDFSGIFEKLAYWIKFSHWCRNHCRRIFAYDFRAHSYSERSEYFNGILLSQGLHYTAFDFLEFGVYQGESLRWWRDASMHPETRFFGFDTFTGLPQKWTEIAIVGRFSTQGQVPDIQDSRFHFEVGLFQNTLPEFLKTFRRQGRLIVHLDADLYSSTLYVLMTLGHLFKPGDLIMFDEFGAVTHEFRAFTDFLSTRALPYEIANATGDFNKVCLLVSGVRADTLSLDDGAVQRLSSA
jgi:O-methyltransferase